MVTPGVYEHYKGGRYKVIGVGLLEASEEPAVVYETLYDNDRSKLWIRTLVDFESMVVVDGKEVPRFKRLSEDESQNL